MSRRKKESNGGSLKVHEEHEFLFGENASRIKITGPGDTDITHYKMADHNPQTGLVWSFSEPGTYLVRYMDEYGVEYDTEEIEVK